MTKARPSYTDIVSADKNAKISVCTDKTNSITSQIVTDGLVFQALKTQWNLLVNSAQEPHPFLLWEWQYTWWDVFSKTKDKLMVVVVSNNNQVIGIAPFYLKKMLIGTSLRYLGEGEHQDEEVCTHYPDIICSPENSQLVVDEVAKQLIKKKSEWDYAHFCFVLEESLLQKLKEKVKLMTSLKKSLGHRYLLNLPETNELFLSSLGKSTKKNFRSKRNRMLKEGEISLEQLDTSNSIEESLDFFANLHRIRQKSKNEASSFDRDRFYNFHKRLLNSISDKNICEIRVLKLNDEIVAMIYNFNIKNKVYSYASGFQSKDDGRLSPMLVFDFLEMESLIEKGFKQYDFLSASSGGSYKQHYRCEEYPVSGLYWFKPTIPGIIKYLGMKLRRVVKRIKNKLIAN